jgi:TetR/AcrR family transcriptional regulator, transcriptional repressor for nem operon
MPGPLKGDQTRQHIIRQAAAVFNRLGYAAASVSDLEKATGLKTGGIYRHFPGGKEDLALAALDFALAARYDRLVTAVAEGRDAVDRLHRVIAVFTNPAADRTPGGCPLMNAAIEHDHAGSPALRARARRAMDRWHALIAQVVADGRALGELKPDVDPADTATVVLATIEGAIMLSGLYHDRESLRTAAAHLSRFIDAELRA